MTALTMHARPDEDDAALRPVPWRRMAGVTWRQHRFALAGVAVLLGALTVYEWLTGESLYHAWVAATTCHPAGSPTCQDLVRAFPEDFVTLGSLLQVVPPLIGAFVGAPVLAREMETGTFRYAWTQGFGRWRWALAKLVLLAAALAAATGAFGVLVSWHYQPYFGAGNRALGLPQLSPFDSDVFSLRGMALPAWTLAAFAIGALAGMLIRRVLPAIVATLAAYTGLAFATGLYLRPRYLTPLVTSSPNLPGTAWIISQWWTKDGRFAFGFPPYNLLNQFCSAGPGSSGKGGGGPSFAQCLAPHGYTQWTSYQPGSRFWPFQWMEAGWLLALSALLIAAAVWLVQRRAA
jgi:ABC-type transport system involved in multi-copper enzyme maturation permease subunit